MNRVSAARTATLLGYFALLILVVAWSGWLAPSEQVQQGLMILLFGGPLLFPLRGLLHGRPYTHAWASYLALLYFIHGVGAAFADSGRGRLLGLAEVLFSVTFFVGAVLYARFRGRELRQAKEKDTGDGG